MADAPMTPAAPLALAALGGLALLALSALDEPAPLTLDGFDPGPSDQAIRRAAKDEARADLAAGRPRWLIYGYPSLARDEYGELLEARFGVTLDAVGGCVVTDGMEVRVRAYDAVIERWLEAQHGPGVLERTWDDAEALHARRASERERARLAAELLIEVILADESFATALDLLGEEPVVEDVEAAGAERAHRDRARPARRGE